MGTSTDAILSYGFEIHTPDDGWLTHEPEDHIEAQPWHKAKCYCDDNADYECDCEPEISEILSEALKDTPLSVEYHCHHDHPVHMIVAYTTTAWRGDPKHLNLTALEQARTEGQWDKHLAAACQRLGITPKQTPHWILSSYWG
jgi:hypothetical protein